MDTEKMIEAVGFTRYSVRLTYSPLADPGARWVAQIGPNALATGPTPDEALALAQDREALGPEPRYPSDDDRAYPDQDGDYTEQRAEADAWIEEHGRVW